MTYEDVRKEREKQSLYYRSLGNKQQPTELAARVLGNEETRHRLRCRRPEKLVLAELTAAEKARMKL